MKLSNMLQHFHHIMLVLDRHEPFLRYIRRTFVVLLMLINAAMFGILIAIRICVNQLTNKSVSI